MSEDKLQLDITLKGKNLKRVKNWQRLFKHKKPQTTINLMIERATLEEKL